MMKKEELIKMSKIVGLFNNEWVKCTAEWNITFSQWIWKEQ